MNLYSDYDYLCNEPFFLEGIGHVKCPTLREIRQIHYSIFSIYVNILSMNLQDYLEFDEISKAYNHLTEAEQASITFFDTLLLSEPQLLYSILRFFFIDPVEYDARHHSFQVLYQDEPATAGQTGVIDRTNFDDFRSFLKQILGIARAEETAQKFKNDYAEKIYQKMQAHKRQEEAKQDSNLTLDNMIRKYCTHNKVGVNILNVWDMTYYQFIVMFNEYRNGRQYDYYDQMAANTFSYTKSSEYKPMDYMKKI